MITVFDRIRKAIRTKRYPSVHVHSDKRSFFINTNTWAEQAVWPEPVPEDPRRVEEDALARSQEQKLEPEVRGRPQGLNTLERWLGKLERKRMRGSR